MNQFDVASCVTHNLEDLLDDLGEVEEDLRRYAHLEVIHDLAEGLKIGDGVDAGHQATPLHLQYVILEVVPEGVDDVQYLVVHDHDEPKLFGVHDTMFVLFGLDHAVLGTPSQDQPHLIELVLGVSNGEEVPEEHR